MVVAVLVAVLVATPQGRAVVTHVLRFAGIELQQEPGPAPSLRSSAALPGERRMPLAEARRHASFPILVPAAPSACPARSWSATAGGSPP